MNLSYPSHCAEGNTGHHDRNHKFTKERTGDQQHHWENQENTQHYMWCKKKKGHNSPASKRHAYSEVWWCTKCVIQLNRRWVMQWTMTLSVDIKGPKKRLQKKKICLLKWLRHSSDLDNIEMWVRLSWTSAVTRNGREFLLIIVPVWSGSKLVV